MNDYPLQPQPPLVSRRWLLTRSALGAAVLGSGALTLTACAEGGLTQVFSTSPSPNEMLQTLAAELSAASSSATEPGMGAFFTTQANHVTQEVLRQCGVDDEGQSPQACTEPAALSGAPRDPEAAYMAVITTDPADMPANDARFVTDQFPLLVGWYAAFATTESQPNLGAVATLEQQPYAEGFAERTAPEQLATLVDLTHQAIYTSGLAMAHAGGQLGIYAAVAARLRELRDAATAALHTLGHPVPEAAAGYSVPETRPQPSDSSRSAELFHEVLVPVTHQLRHLAVSAESPVAREWVARWCGLIARGEAAMESIQGKDPLDVTVRGA
ncbi:MAG TPA: ferritin-like domain-containing protein [Candidatus Corynebacterium gallistercoris]|uniref:Ferritin-like domain-containing protein n=1 Tax=Candidatus Corynebacterium gallistercoris TaxID=2838530 RepID=A0A9D1UR26_9CORY|nr:ferritin-like domain-containing protein [Candidatus Corynebacterium gallistercoris]